MLQGDNDHFSAGCSGRGQGLRGGDTGTSLHREVGDGHGSIGKPSPDAGSSRAKGLGRRCAARGALPGPHRPVQSEQGREPQVVRLAMWVRARPGGAGRYGLFEVSGFTMTSSRPRHPGGGVMVSAEAEDQWPPSLTPRASWPATAMALRRGPGGGGFRTDPRCRKARGGRPLTQPHTSGTVGSSSKPKHQKPFRDDGCNIKSPPTLSADGVGARDRASAP